MSKEKTPLNVIEAIEKVKKTCKCNFDSTIEVHLNVALDPKKQDQQIRVTTSLPYGTGKTKKVAVMAAKPVKNADIELSEDDLKKIESGTLKPGTDFDAVVVEPSYMPKIARVAKILGPKGMMPNPKSGTVTENVEQTVNEIKKGKVEIKMEQTTPIIHTIIGKKSFDTNSLAENLKEVITTLRQNKPQKAKPDWLKECYISSSMSPSVLVDLSTVK
ncbi:MAG: 50S ribosomal protein L1 [Patescibacteria group bacterium]